MRLWAEREPAFSAGKGPPRAGAINSVEECYPHTVEVAGSNPASPTSQAVTS